MASAFRTSAIILPSSWFLIAASFSFAERTVVRRSKKLKAKSLPTGAAQAARTRRAGDAFSGLLCSCALAVVAVERTAIVLLALRFVI